MCPNNCPWQTGSEKSTAKIDALEALHYVVNGGPNRALKVHQDDAASGNALAAECKRANLLDFGLLTEDSPRFPDLVELVFTRITESGGFQGTRNALGLVGAMVDASGEGAYLMTAAHCRISDTTCADRLQDLNPAGDLINCAQSNYRDLASQPFSEAIASATLLASLVPGSPVGLSKDEIVRHAVKPG